MDAVTLARPVGLDVVKGLEARGSALVGVVNAATAALVGVIADALVCEAWRGHGINTPEHWAGLRFGLSPQRARRLVAAARALAVLPQCRAAFGAGEISEDHVAVIVNAQVTPHHDGEVVGLARHATVGQLRHALSWLPKPPAAQPDETQPDETKPDETKPDETKPDETKPDGKRRPDPEPRVFVSRAYRDDGTWSLQAIMPGVDGAVVDKAIEAAIDKLFRLRYGPDADPALRQKITVIDALRYLAEVGLEAMDPATAGHPERMPSERYLVNVHLRGDDPDRARIHLGPLMPSDLTDEASCDAYLRAWITDTAGNVNLGRTVRTVDPKARTVIETRDGGCRVPGCHATRGLRIHHIVHWADGGPTDTANLVALCPAHHRLVHQGHYRITGNADGELVFTDDNGRPVRHEPPAPVHRPPPDAAAHLDLPPPQWANRRGERAHWDCMIWTDHPHPAREN
jgi:hypothetical protein